MKLCQNRCQLECQIECQIICKKYCRIECQNKYAMFISKWYARNYVRTVFQGGEQSKKVIARGNSSNWSSKGVYFPIRVLDTVLPYKHGQQEESRTGTLYSTWGQNNEKCAWTFLTVRVPGTLGQTKLDVFGQDMIWSPPSSSENIA